MSYNTLLSILAPISRVEHARELACCFGECGLAERGSFASLQWEKGGVLYSPLECPIRDGLKNYIINAADERPVLASVPGVNMTLAQQAMDEAAVVLSLSESIDLIPDTIIIALGCDVPALAAACGLTRIPPAE